MKKIKIEDIVPIDYDYIRSTWLIFSEHFGYDKNLDYLNIIRHIVNFSKKRIYYPQVLFPAEIYSLIKQPFSIRNDKNTICPKKLKTLAKEIGKVSEISDFFAVKRPSLAPNITKILLIFCVIVFILLILDHYLKGVIMGLLFLCGFFVIMPGYLIIKLFFLNQWKNYIKRERENRVNKYHSDVRKLNEDLTYASRFCSRDIDLKNLLKTNISHGCTARHKPVSIFNRSYFNEPQIGISEHLLSLKLEEKYSTLILDYYKLGKYYPDLILQINDKYFIDIEIDEPYVGNTKQAIHYIGSDDIRNNYFQSQNWFILRFSENNIQEHLDECIYIIDNLIQFLNNFDSNYLDLISIHQDLIKEKRWTKEEADLMANNAIRDRYFNKQ